LSPERKRWERTISSISRRRRSTIEKEAVRRNQIQQCATKGEKREALEAEHLIFKEKKDSTTEDNPV